MDNSDSLVGLIRKGMRQTVIQWFTERQLSSEEILKVLEDMLVEIGDLWEKDEIPLTTVYIASKIAEELSETLLRPSDVEDQKRGKIVIGTLAEDFHSLGKNLVIRFLTPFFDIIDLGNDVGIDEFLKKAKEADVDIIAVSALMMNSVVSIKKLREKMDSESWTRKPLLVVGGAPFVIDSDLAEEVGADAVGLSAMHAVEVCLKIMEES
ncbi:MAG: cobalamin B12-binding domain-containing protein [Candidatus Thorarchaeota archaeon]|jgi:methanogenic corrinoid protein MtbC1